MIDKKIRDIIVRSVFRALPYRLFVVLYPKLRKTKLVDYADAIYLERFHISSPVLLSAPQYINKLKQRKRYMYIKKGLWDYKIANFCFVKDMLASIIWCVDRGYIPIIDIYPDRDSKYIDDKKRLWEYFFTQPIIHTEQAEQKKFFSECPITTSSIRPRFMDVYDENMISLWHYLLESFIEYNKETQKYLEEEYNSLIKGKKVVACVLRSTDYKKLRPKGHPKQPELQEVFSKIEEVMKNEPVDYIYLATEDGKIAEAFKKQFPNQVLENKRHYFDEGYNNSNLEFVSQVHFDRANDDYYKMLEYLSSINIVSKCDYLISGLSGGSEMAVYRNGNKYKYSYIFDKGVY